MEGNGEDAGRGSWFEIGCALGFGALRMTDLTFVRSTPSVPDSTRSRPWIALLYAAALVAGGTGIAVAATVEPSASSEWQLALLLRFMAVLKAAMVLGAVGLTHWRLRQPIGDALFAGYVTCLSLMLVAPGLIWSLQHIALGAALFHAGLLGFLLLAWRDDATGKLLSRRPISAATRS
jgi:hypothetical protein